MATLTYVKYELATEKLLEGGNAGSDNWQLILSNTAPNVATNTTAASATELGTAGGYTAGGVNCTVTSAPITYADDLSKGSYALSGKTVSDLLARNDSLSKGTYILAGYDLNDVLAGASTNYSDDLLSGAYALSGHDITDEYLPATDENLGADNQERIRQFYRTYRVRRIFEAQNARKAKKSVEKLVTQAIEEVAQLGISEPSAETALRVRLRNVEWHDYYLDLQNTLREALTLEIAHNLNELRQIESHKDYLAELQLDRLKENNRRIALIMMLA